MRSLLDRLPALSVVRGEGGVWVAGGAVRDLLLGREPRDVDLVVEDDAPAVARRAAERLNGELVLHDRFGTATVLAPGAALNFATAREETYARPGALPDVRLGAPIERDLARRDFTVNAIAVRVPDGEVAAVPHAMEDLDARLLRVLHDESFADDPTRLLRLARYAARLRFGVEPRTGELAAAARVDTVTPARLGAELRLLLGEPQPGALLALERYGLGRAVLGDAFAPDAERIERALALRTPDARADLVALAAALAPGDAAPVTLATRLDALQFTAPERDAVIAAVAAPPVAGGDDVALWRALRRLAPEAVAVAGARGDADAARRWLEDVRHRRLAVTGEDFVAAGLSGPPVGRALEAATEAMLAGRAPDRATQLEAGLVAARP
jgi:tRNA nucleotidyltransferase (CCA-adding enzyme)